MAGDRVTVASGDGIAPPKLWCSARSLQGGSHAQTWREVAVGPSKAPQLLQSPWGLVENLIR
jgi:hypothetical protein